MGVEAITAVLGAFVGGIAVYGATWRMLAHFDRENRKEHGALAKGIADVRADVATLGAKVDILLTDRGPGGSGGPLARGLG